MVVFWKYNQSNRLQKISIYTFKITSYYYSPILKGESISISFSTMMRHAFCAWWPSVSPSHSSSILVRNPICLVGLPLQAWEGGTGSAGEATPNSPSLHLQTVGWWCRGVWLWWGSQLTNQPISPPWFHVPNGWDDFVGRLREMSGWPSTRQICSYFHGPYSKAERMPNSIPKTTSSLWGVSQEWASEAVNLLSPISERKRMQKAFGVMTFCLYRGQFQPL